MHQIGPRDSGHTDPARGDTRQAPHRSAVDHVFVSNLLALGDCATAVQRPFAAENVPSAAGFQMKLPDTPERRASLRTRPRGSQVEYVYADPTGCACLYVGNEVQYQQYRRYALEKQLSDERLDAARTYGYGLDTLGE